MLQDPLARRQTRFVLWRPAFDDPAPALFIGPVEAGAPLDLTGFREIPLVRSSEFPGLWERPAASCGLDDDSIYLYWFKVRDSRPYAAGRRVLYCTDPFACCVDRRVIAPAPGDPDGAPVPHAAFYSYAYPEPAGFSGAAVRPAAAFFSQDLKEFVLPYDAVRQSASPDDTLLEFLQTTYEAAANLAKWDRRSLEGQADSQTTKQAPQ